MSPASERSERGIRHLFFTAIALPILLAAIAGVWLAWQVERIADAADWIDGTDRVIALAGDVQRLVVDREMGLRAFLFTRDQAFLEPFQRTSPDEDLDELEQLLRHKPAEIIEVNAIRDAYRAWSQQTEAAIAAPAEGRTVAALRARRAALEGLRARAAELVTREKSARLDHVRGLDRQTRLTTAGALGLLGLLAGASSLALGLQIRLIGSLLKRERDALGKAREALRAKDTFLTNLSHELRTPLTPILGWVSVLRTKRLGGDALDRALALIERNAQAEVQIIDDVLDVGRIATGSLRIAPQVLDPVTFVRAAVDVVALPARAKGITIDVSVEPDLPAILGDPNRLQQVAWNLLGNAVKFTPRGGHVQIRLERADEGVRLRVTDDGEGIAPDFLPHVFDDFRQGDGSMTRAHGGLGLGLAIVKHLVELHGGEVRAASDGPGKGATFTVTLPAAGSLPASPAEAPRSTSLRGVRVLVVDDDPTARELFTTVLRDHGAAVHAAESASSALGALDRASVDVVVSDLGMPGTSGYDLLGSIRASSALGRKIPALALSAYAGSEEAERATAAGFQMHLAKPVTPERLVGAVAELAGVGAEAR